MLFAADIGNTNITVGIYDGQELVKSWNIATIKEKTDDEYGITLLNLIEHHVGSKNIDTAIISSVVPPLTDRFQLAMEKYLGISPYIVTHKTKTGITLDVEKPEEVGCDRIANACAAYNLYSTPAAVIDFGTATNFDIVTPDAKFIGGIIAPGLKVSAENFNRFTNLLPKIKVDEVGSVIGRNTVQNMLSGVVIGHAAMIDGMIERIEEQLGTRITTIATGGFSSTITTHMKRQFDHFDKDLTLKGLHLIHELNQERSRKGFQPIKNKDAKIFAGGQDQA